MVVREDLTPRLGVLVVVVPTRAVVVAQASGARRVRVWCHLPQTLRSVTRLVTLAHGRGRRLTHAVLRGERGERLIRRSWRIVRTSLVISALGCWLVVYCHHVATCRLWPTSFDHVCGMTPLPPWCVCMCVCMYVCVCVCVCVCCVCCVVNTHRYQDCTVEVEVESVNTWIWAHRGLQLIKLASDGISYVYSSIITPLHASRSSLDIRGAHMRYLATTPRNFLVCRPVYNGHFATPTEEDLEEAGPLPMPSLEGCSLWVQIAYLGADVNWTRCVRARACVCVCVPLLHACLVPASIRASLCECGASCATCAHPPSVAD